MAVTSLEELFHETLKDMYYAEKKLTKALPKMMKKAKSPELKEAIQSHLTETETHVERLVQVFEGIGKRPASKTCEAMNNILAEADDVVSEIKDERTLDAGIISSSQTVEHYEIARYGTLVSWARELGMKDEAQLLQSTLDEEKAADQKLSGLAQQFVNQQAAA